MLLGSRSFKGNVLGKHMQLQGITPAHFAAWVRLWNEHTARLFAPEVAHGCRPQRMGGPQSLPRVFWELPGFATPRQDAHPTGLSASRPFSNHGVGDRPR